MSTTSPECVRTNELLLDYAYGELAGAPLQALEQHLPGCEKCQAELAALKSTRRVMSSLQPEPAPAGGLESLLAYAEQQAKRQAAPRRPRWLGWLFAAVPAAAAVLVTTTVVLHNADKPLASASREEVSAQAVAAPSATKLQAQPVAAEAPKEAELAEAGERRDREAALDKVAPMQPPATHAAAERAKFGHVAKQKTAMSEPMLQSSAPGGDVAAEAALPPPPAAPRPEPVAKDAKEEVATAEADRKVDAAPAKKSAGRGMEKVAASEDAFAAGPAPAAAAPAPAPSANMLGMASGDAAKGGAASGFVPDGLARAETFRRSGEHQAASDAYRAYYQAHRGTARGGEALFSAALEAQAAGLLARAAEDFERYAREFPSGSRAPAALARAIQIRRSSEGEGAATTLEQDLLHRYPDSPEARGLPARTETRRAASPQKAARMKADFDDDQVAPAAPASAPAQPAEQR